MYENVAFDFLGYTFQPRRARNRQGKNFVSFLPAISARAAKGIRKTIRASRIASMRNNQRLEDLAKLIDPVVRGWMNYYGWYYRTKCIAVRIVERNMRQALKQHNGLRSLGSHDRCRLNQAGNRLWR